MGYEWHRPLETKSFQFILFTTLAVMVGGLVLVIPPFYLQGTIEPIPGVMPYSALEQEGRDLYIREGCIEDVKYYTNGCANTRSCGRAVALRAKGKTVTDALLISAGELIRAGECEPEEGRHCAILAVSIGQTSGHQV